MLIPFLYVLFVVQSLNRIDRNLTVLMKAESTVARAQVFAGKRVPTTGRQYCIQKPKPKPKPVYAQGKLLYEDEHLRPCKAAVN